MSDYLTRDAEYLSPALARAHEIVITHAKGSYVFDDKGNKYLDFTSGIAVNQLGHSHPEVVSAIAEQAAKCIHTSCVVHYPANIDLAEKLSEICPGDLSMSFFSNSGAEAMDGAIKLAKLAKPGRTNILVHRGAFHGRTLGATALTTSKSSYRRYYEPLMPGVHVTEFPNIYEIGTTRGREFLVDHLLEIFQRYCDSVLHPESIMAIVVEPVQGEGGYIPASGLHGGKNYLQVLREFCDKYGILLIFDEVQSGMGRTGKWFASEHFGVVPDIQVMAKGLSGGMPLGAFVARKDLMKQMPPGSHGTTFGGNPVSCAAALKMIEILKRDKVIENVVKKGEEVFEFISSKFPNSDTRNPVPEGSPKTNSPKSGHGFSAYHNPKIQVRGLGLMIALVFPDAEIVNKIKKQALAEGLLLLGCGTYGNIIRLAPDLLISSADLRAGLEIITKIIEE
jgi:4-aminobutyrate aminotransferase